MAISMIAFRWVQNIYNYIYMFVSLICVVYVVKEVTTFPGARSINGRKRMRAQALQKESCVAYVATN